MSNRSAAVEAWFDTYDNPQKELVQAVREAVLDADPRISETIKWKAPTFMFQGNIASFFPRSKSHVVLMFHTGAVLPDPGGLLEGDGPVSRVARFSDHEDLALKTPRLQDLIRAWIVDKESGRSD